MELKQYLQIIRKRIWLILAVVIVVCGLAAVKSFLFTTVEYRADAKIIVNKTTQANGTETVNYSDVQTNLMLMNSYKEIIKSSAILDKVAQQYPELKNSPAAMSHKIYVSAADQSQVMNLTYIDTSYKEAAKTVNAIAVVFKQQIPSIMKVDNITILNQADEQANAYPLSTNPLLTVMIAFLVALLISLGIVFIMEYLDQTYKTAEELEEELGLPVLANVITIKKSDRRQPKQSNRKVGEGAYATPIN